MLGIIAAVVFGIPGVLIVGTIVYMALRGDPAPTAPATAGPAPSQAAESGPKLLTLVQLKAGDCFNSVPIPPDGSTVSIGSVEGVPCSDPHTRQVVNTFAYPNTTWESDGDAKSSVHCASAFDTKLRKEIRADGRYLPARIHGDLRSSGQNTVYVACVVGTEAPTTGSALA